MGCIYKIFQVKREKRKILRNKLYIIKVIDQKKKKKITKFIDLNDNLKSIYICYYYDLNNR